MDIKRIRPELYRFQPLRTRKGQSEPVLKIDYSDFTPRCINCGESAEELTLCFRCGTKRGFYDLDVYLAGFAQPWLSMPWRKQKIKEIDEERSE